MQVLTHGEKERLRFYTNWRPALLRATAPSQCGLECAPKVTPSRCYLVGLQTRTAPSQWFRMYFKRNPLERSGCRSPLALAHRVSPVLQTLPPCTAPSQCGVERCGTTSQLRLRIRNLIGAQHGSELIWFRMCFKRDPIGEVGVKTTPPAASVVQQVLLGGQPFVPMQKSADSAYHLIYG